MDACMWVHTYIQIRIPVGLTRDGQDVDCLSQVVYLLHDCGEALHSYMWHLLCLVGGTHAKDVAGGAPGWVRQLHLERRADGNPHAT